MCFFLCSSWLQYALCVSYNLNPSSLCALEFQRSFPDAKYRCTVCFTVFFVVPHMFNPLSPQHLPVERHFVVSSFFLWGDFHTGGLILSKSSVLFLLFYWFFLLILCLAYVRELSRNFQSSVRHSNQTINPEYILHWNG